MEAPASSAERRSEVPGDVEVLLSDEVLWDLAKSAESRTLARVSATTWRQLNRNDGKELIAAVATLHGQAGNVPLGGMMSRERVPGGSFDVVLGAAD